MYQEKKISILLEDNGKRSASKIIWELNIYYFFMTDQVEKENLQIESCPIDKMWGYFMTKTTQGPKFKNLRNYVLGGNV